MTNDTRRWSVQIYLLAIACLTWAALAAPAHAVFWNNDSLFGHASASGLTDRPHWFQNTHVVLNATNNTRGTATLLNAEWAITVRHVIQNGDNYGQVAAPEDISINVLGSHYDVDQVFTPDDGSDLALIHLRGGVGDALDMTGNVNRQFDELSRVAVLGGFGAYGHISTAPSGGRRLGTTNSDVRFHHAYNVVENVGDHLEIVADGEPALKQNRLVEGIAGPGDSGGPMFGYYGDGLPSRAKDLSDWRLIGLTATSNAGRDGAVLHQASYFTRLANHANWIDQTLASIPAPGPSSTLPWTMVSGTGLYDSGGDKLSVTNSEGPAVVEANFGPGRTGYTLENIGDRISLTARLDTAYVLEDLQCRFGFFHDPDTSPSEEATEQVSFEEGYFVASATEDNPQGIYPVPSKDETSESWWSLPIDAQQAALEANAATGDYQIRPGFQGIEGGVYFVTLDYVRVPSGIDIRWSLVSIDDQGNPDGFYMHHGSALEDAPMMASRNFNKLGFMLSDTGYRGTIVLDDIEVQFTKASAFSRDLDGDGDYDDRDFAMWQKMYGDQALPRSEPLQAASQADFDGWEEHLASSDLDDPDSLMQIPEPSTLLLGMFLWSGFLVARRYAF